MITPEDMSQSLEAESRIIVNTGFDNLFCGKLPAGYTEPWTAIYVVSHLWVLNCRQSACFGRLGPDEKYRHVTLFVNAVFI